MIAAYFHDKLFRVRIHADFIAVDYMCQSKRTELWLSFHDMRTNAWIHIRIIIIHICVLYVNLYGYHLHV